MSLTFLALAGVFTALLFFCAPIQRAQAFLIQANASEVASMRPDTLQRTKAFRAFNQREHVFTNASGNFFHRATGADSQKSNDFFLRYKTTTFVQRNRSVFSGIDLKFSLK